MPVPPLDEAIRALYEKRAKLPTWTVRSVWASEIGHPCERYLVYRQTHTNKAKKINARLAQLFDVGNLHGREIVHLLDEALHAYGPTRDCRVERTEMPIPENQDGITGKMDLAVAVPQPAGRPRYIPVEFKALSDVIFNQLDDVQDMMNSNFIFMRKYPAQLTCYMHYFKETEGVFLIRNKQTGDHKMLTMSLDPAYRDSLLAKARRINSTVTAYKTAAGPAAGVEVPAQANLLPPRMNWTQSLCGHCPFLGICLPDMSRVPGIECLLGKDELDEAVRQREDLHDASLRYGRADTCVKGHLRALCDGMNAGDIKTLMLPHYCVEVKIAERTGYEVPADIKSQYKVKTTFPKIVSVDKV